MRRLGRAVRVDRAVIADDPGLAPLDAGEAADRRGTVGRLEVQPVAGVHDAGDHFAHVIGLAIVGRHDAEDFLGVIGGRRRGGGGADAVPFQLGHHLARQPDGVAVVLGHPFAEPGNRRVHFRAAQFLVGRDLAGRGFQQRRPGEEDLGLAAHHDDVVAEARLIGPARGRGAVHHGDDRTPRRRQPRQIGEGRPAADEQFGLAQQVRPRALDELDIGQAVFERDLLEPEALVEAVRRRRAALDRAVARVDGAAYARHRANARNASAAAGVRPAIVVVTTEPAQRRDFQPVRTAIEQQVDAVARRQLAALGEFCGRLVAMGADARLDRPDFGQQLQMRGAVLGETRRMNVDLGSENRHAASPPGAFQGAAAM